ncbi:unnamed protein product [Anisakis simplex]|uniref:RalBP1-associated Eps domain-containing protein 1 n=1 Tax=Anisakis simplex TaxID=6269 RepID=A0A0M3K9Y1_ANISI|nr:unnamed protein product [Anisakis simplex]
MTTEAIHSTATQQLVAVSAQIRPQWREVSSTIHNTSSSSPFYAPPSSSVIGDRSFDTEQLSLYSKPVSIKDSSMHITENVQQASANSSYPPITTPRSYERHDKKSDYQIMSGSNAKDDRNATGGFEAVKEERKKEDATLYSSKNASNKEKSNWQTLVDSEDETSEEYDAGDDDSEEDDENDEKAGVSDTETRNLLEDGLEDDEDYHDSANIASDDINTSATQHTPSINNLVSEKGSTNEDKMQERLLASNISDESLFEMSHEQIAYYKKCFVYLIELTQGMVDLKGAVHGANEKVVEFFKKSGLSTETLSKIWTLSDVNADGFLDLAEFSTAMHLIVLNLKGKIPVPDHLPNSIRPPLTPQRMLNKTTNQSVPATNQSNWKQFDFDESKGDNAQTVQPSYSNNVNNHQQHHHSLSDDHLHVHINKSETPEHLSDFSDVPPLLVDGRPTALKATQPLICPSTQPAGAVSQPTAITASRVPPPSSSSSLKLMNEEALRLTLSPSLPKGPPPKPPPRPSSKGHGRSASLDLNTLANTKLVCSANGMNSGMMLAQTPRGGTLPTQSSLMRFNNNNSATNYVSQQQQQSVISSTSSISQSSNILPPHSSVSQVCGLQTPPLSARPSFAAPPPPRRCTVQDSETQTEHDQDSTDASRNRPLSLSSSKHMSASSLTQQPELIQFNVQLEKRIEQLLADENFAMSESEKNGSGTSANNVNWKERCCRLQKLNEELEMERCKLAQIRLELQQKLQDVSGRSANVTTPSSIKPTSL